MLESGSTEAMHSDGSESDHQAEHEIDYRYATREDVENFYGRRLDGTLRAFVWTLDGKVHGVIGLSRADGAMTFFSDNTTEFLPHIRSFRIRRSVLEVMKWIRECPMIVYSVAYDGDGYQGSKVLASLGFQHYSEGTWIWLG